MTRNKKKRPAKSRGKRYRGINSLLAKRRLEAEDNQYVSEDSQESNIAVDVQKSVAEMLRSWINCHGITTRAVNDLLQILKKSGNIKWKTINNLWL